MSKDEYDNVVKCIVSALNSATQDERQAIMSDVYCYYCSHCLKKLDWINNKKCWCWNDE